jgi:hypothetical protein
MTGSDRFLKDEKTLDGQRGIIVGFDPGLTVGLAILDLEGKILFIGSFKEISRADVIKNVIKYGKTALIATDVYPPPKTVKKLASILNSRIHSPYHVMSVESKTELVDAYLKLKSSVDRSKVVPSHEISQNAHERDALAAAVKTYKDYQNKLLQIEKRAESFNLPADAVDTVKIMVINDVPITKAIKQVLENIEAEKSRKLPAVEMGFERKVMDVPTSMEVSGTSEDSYESELEGYMETVSRLKKQIKSQKRAIKKLKAKNRSLESAITMKQSEVSKLQSKMDKMYHEYSTDVLRQKEVASKVKIIKNLQKKYDEERSRRKELEKNLKLIMGMESLEVSGNVVPVKIIESFTRDGINRACEYWKIKQGDVVFLMSSEGGGSQTASLLIDMGVKAVITKDKISHPAEEEFERNMVPILAAENLNLKVIDEFAVVEAELLTEEIENWHKTMESRILDEDKKKLLKVIDEYRAKRKR